MMVSVALFAVISVFVVGSYIMISSLQRTTSARQQVASEERFVLDTLGREITWAVAIPDCPADGCDKIRFASRPRSDTAIRTIEYKYDAASQNVLKAETKPFGPCQTAPDVHNTKDPLDDEDFPAECYQKIFSDAVKITSLKFFVSNNVDDTSQVVVTVAINGSVTVKGVTSPLFLSSTFTPRFLQDTAILINGGLPMPPVIMGSHGDCQPDPSAACNNLGTSWVSDWSRVENVDDYHTYVCWGNLCDLSANGPSNSASGWFEIPPYPWSGWTMSPNPQTPPKEPISCVGEYGTYYLYNIDGGVPIHMAIRAHRHIDNAWSAFSNIRSTLSLPRNPDPCVPGGPYVPPPAPTVPPAPGGTSVGHGQGGEN
jgi:hypothetical protein